MDGLQKLFSNLLDKLGSNHDDLITTFSKEARLHLSQIEEIPTLSQTTSNLTLVKFKCMVHDVFDDEYACSLIRNNDSITHCLFSDEVPNDYTMIEKSLIQRCVYYGSTIPGESSWSKNRGTMKRSIDTQENLDFSELRIKSIKSDLDDEIKVNQIVEFIGIYNENNLYALDFKKLISPYTSSKITNFSEARKETIMYLTKYFGEDLISEYYLIHLISQIFSRNGNMPQGRLSLNFKNCKDVKSIAQLTSNVYPNCVTVKFNDIITKKLISVKNYDTNRLEKGFYQLSNGTHLLIDETDIKEMELKEEEVKNILITKKMIQEQLVPYDFKFYSLDFPVDVPVLTCSISKSIFDDAMDIRIKLRDCGKVSSDFDLTLIRNYLLHCKHYVADYKIGQECTDFIEQDFVRERKENNIQPDRLYLWLNLARLFTLSLGLNELTIDIYKKTKSMDEKRLTEFQ
jgi:hypothetical protein